MTGKIIGGRDPADGVAITPEAIPGARLESLDPRLASLPDYRAGQPVSIRMSPDGKTLAVVDQRLQPDGRCRSRADPGSVERRRGHGPAQSRAPDDKDAASQHADTT
jgi:hypothetical protein